MRNFSSNYCQTKQIVENGPGLIFMHQKFNWSEWFSAYLQNTRKSLDPASLIKVIKGSTSDLYECYDCHEYAMSEYNWATFEIIYRHKSTWFNSTEIEK